MPAVMHRSPCPPLDDLFHPLDSQIYQVPQQGQDEALSCQAQVEGKIWTLPFFLSRVSDDIWSHCVDCEPSNKFVIWCDLSF